MSEIKIFFSFTKKDNLEIYEGKMLKFKVIYQINIGTEKYL